MSGPAEQVAIYPSTFRERDQWIKARRQGVERRALDPRRPSHFLLEEERSAAGTAVSMATIFLTNRECSWRCLMCDLWRNTLTQGVAVGDIPAQIDFALERLATAEQVKLYNSGSFFDPRAIPVADYEPIAERVQSFERTIVESHPSLIGENAWRFRGLLQRELEVAMGLETIHPQIGPRLNKGMTPAQFARAAETLGRRDISVRAFILVQLPFVRREESSESALRSVQFAFDCGATVAVLIPTRLGNGALDLLAAQGEFDLPTLAQVEEVVARSVTLKRGRVFADLWDLEQFSTCRHCFELRLDRLRTINRQQQLPPPVFCEHCVS